MAERVTMVSTKTARRALGDCEIALVNKKWMWVRPMHRTESGLTFQIPTSWPIKGQRIYCPLTPVKIWNHMKLPMHNARILIGRYVVEEHRRVFVVADLDELMQEVLPDDLDVYVREPWTRYDYTVTPEVAMRLTKEGAKYYRQTGNASIPSHVKWGTMHSVYSLDDIMESREMVEMYIRERQGFKGDLDLAHKGKDGAVTYVSQLATT